MSNDVGLLGQAAAQMAAALARELDARLAPLVATGGKLTRQSSPLTGIELYFVDGRLALEVGPLKLTQTGTQWDVCQTFKAFSIPTNDQIVPTDVPTRGVVGA